MNPAHLHDHTEAVSPLMLADRMLTLAKEADTAGYIGTADRLLQLAYHVWDQQPLPHN